MGAKEVKKHKQDLFDLTFELRMASKQMAKEANKVEKLMEKEKKKVAQAISKGHNETARIYAENAIRNKQESNNLRRIAGKMDALSAKVAQADRMQNVIISS